MLNRRYTDTYGQIGIYWSRIHWSWTICKWDPVGRRDPYSASYYKQAIGILPQQERPSASLRPSLQESSRRTMTLHFRASHSQLILDVRIVHSGYGAHTISPQNCVSPYIHPFPLGCPFGYSLAVHFNISTLTFKQYSHFPIIPCFDTLTIFLHLVGAIFQ